MPPPAPKDPRLKRYVEDLEEEHDELYLLVAALYEENEALRMLLAKRDRQVLALLPDLDPGG